MVTEFSDPWVQACPIGFQEPVKLEGHLGDFGTDPPDGFNEMGVLVAKIFPVNDPFMVENPIAKPADSIQPSLNIAAIV